MHTFLTSLFLSLCIIITCSTYSVGADGQPLTSVFDATVYLALSNPSEAGSTCGTDTTSGLIARLNSLFNVDTAIASDLFQVGTGAVNTDPSSNTSCVTRIYLGGGYGGGAVVSKATAMSGCCLSSTLRTISETLQSATSSDAQLQLLNGILPLLHISSLTEVAAGSSDFPTSPASCTAADPTTYCSTSSSSTTTAFTPTSAPIVSGDIPKTTFDASKFFGSRSCIDFFSNPDVATSLPSNLGIDSSLVVRKGSTQLNTTTPLHLCAAGDTLTYTSFSEFTFSEPTPAPATLSEGSAPSIFNMASAMGMFLHTWSTSSTSSSTSEDAADPSNVMCSKHYGGFGQYGLLRVGDLKRSATSSSSSYNASQGLTCAALLNTTRLLESTTAAPHGSATILSASPFTYTINFKSGTSISSLLSGFQSALDAALVDAQGTTSTSEKNTTFLEAIIVRPLWVEPSVSGGRATAVVVGFDYTYTSADEALLPWDRREYEIPLFNRNVFYNCIWQQGMSKIVPPPPPGPPGREVRDFPLMWIGTGITAAMTIFMIFVIRRRPMERQDPLGNKYDKSLLAEAMNAAESNYRFAAQQSGAGPSKSRRRADSQEAAAAAGLDRGGKARDAEMASVQVDGGEDQGGGETAEGTRYFREEFAKDLPEGMLGGGALVLHNKSVPSYQQAMIDRKYEGPRPVTSVGKSGAGKRVDQAAFDGDDSANPVAAVGGSGRSSPALPKKDGRESPQHYGEGGGKSTRRFNPQQEGKALFADSATSSVIHTGNGVDVVVTRDAFAGGGRRVKTAKKAGPSNVGDAGEEDPFGW